MAIPYDSVFGFIRIVSFQLLEWVQVTEKSVKTVLRFSYDMSGFAYQAIPTRHTVRI